MKRRTVPKSNPWARPCLKIAILGLLLAPASTLVAAEHSNAPRVLTTSLPSATEAYLRRGFGFGLADAGALDMRQRAALRQWAPTLETIGFEAPERSYLRNLFRLPRPAYLTELLKQPKLLQSLPAFARIQAALSLPAPVDKELRVALETLQRLGPIQPGTVRWLRRLTMAGYRFSFADLDLLAAASSRPNMREMVATPAAMRKEIERRLNGREHVARETTRLSESTANLKLFTCIDLLRIRLLMGSLRSAAVRRRIAGLIERARDKSVEIGGVVTWERGKIRWRDLPSQIREADRYRRPDYPRFPVELVAFHLHATVADDRPAAGPSLMDAFGAAFDGRPKLVITDLGAGRFDVDYYRDAHAMGRDEEVRGRLKTVDLDLGVFAASNRDEEHG